MSVLFYSIGATILVSLISLIGIFFLFLRRKKIEKILFFLISFSAGSLMGGAFFHLLPEGIEEAGEAMWVFQITVLGFLIFYILERILRWHHCHEEHCETHKVIGYQNLLGDGMHNFLDGLIIVSAFSVSFSLGIAVTISVILHEVPQEISDFGVLLYSGFSQSKALLYNFISASMALVGAVAGFFLIESSEKVAIFLLPLAAGGFIYIAASDMVPELHKEKKLKKSFLAFFFFVLALVMMRLMAHAH